MNKKDDKRALIETILLYKEKIKQTPAIKKMIQKLQQKLIYKNDKPK